MKPTISPYSHCLLFMSNAFARTMARMAEAQFSTIGVNMTQAFLLMSVVRQPGITVGALAREVLLDQSTVSRALERMVQKGWVHQVERGSRVEHLALPTGRKLEKEVRATWGKVMLAYEGEFTEQEAGRWAGELDHAMLLLRERDLL